MPPPAINILASLGRVRAVPDGQPSKSFPIEDKDAIQKAEEHLASFGQLELYRANEERRKRPKKDDAAKADSSLVPPAKPAGPPSAASESALAGASVAASDDKPSSEVHSAVVDVEALVALPRFCIPVMYSNICCFRMVVSVFKNGDARVWRHGVLCFCSGYQL